MFTILLPLNFGIKLNKFVLSNDNRVIKIAKKYKLNCKKISQKINMLEMNQLFEHAIKESIPLYGWEYKKFRKLRGNQKNIY